MHLSLPRAWILPGLFLPAMVAAQAPADTPVRSTPATSTPEVIELEEYRVTTGTNISRVESSNSLPVSVLDFSQMEAIGANSAVELFDYLPQGGVLQIAETGTLGADARGDVASLNLRGLGSNNTLVLLNGRRLPPHPISQAISGIPSLAVNVNILPTVAMDRTEILRDGASAIYGADATAGVVNTILKDDYTRTEASFRYGDTEDGGAREWRATFSIGETFNDGKTNLFGVIDFFDRTALRATDREWSADADVRRSGRVPEPWGDNVDPRDSDFDNRSSTSQYGNWVRGSFNAQGVFVGARPTSNRGIVTTPTASATMSTSGVFFLVPTDLQGTGSRFISSTPSRFDPITANYYYNLNLNRVLLPAIQRTNAIIGLNHELSDRWKLFADALLFRSDSVAYRDPTGIDSTDDPGLFVPASNPWNPFGVRFYDPAGAPNADGTPRLVGTPGDVLFAGGTGARPPDFREKLIEVESVAYRGVVGVKGKLFQDWDFESALLYGFAETTDAEQFNVRESRLRQALARTDNTAFNPFGWNFAIVNNVITPTTRYVNPASVVDPLYDTFIRTGTTTLFTWDAKMSGALFEMPAGDLLAALGVEYRVEGYKDFRPEFHGMNPASAVAANPTLFRANDNDFIALSPNVNIDDSRDVMSIFTEIAMPIISPKQDIPLVYAIDIDAAARYETFGGGLDALTPKIGLSWRPSPWLRFRVSYNESFRAPNLVQSNTSRLQRSVTGVSDPYRFEVTGAITDGSTARTVFRQGSEDLDPERADTVLAGVVIEPPFLKGFSFEADYFQLSQKDAIENTTATRALQIDETLLDAYTQAQLAAGVAIGSITTNSGTPNYVGSAKVNRAPVTQADIDAYAAYNATRPANQQRAPVGAVLSVVDDYLNIAGKDIHGFDFGATWNFRKTRIGDIRLRGEWTYYTLLNEQASPDDPVESVLWEDGNFKWKGNVTLTWRPTDNATWGLIGSYYGSFMDPGAATTQTVYEQLGKPDYIVVFNDVGGVVRYRYLVEGWLTFNTYFNYRFGASEGLFKGVSLRLGVNNVTGEDPPVADESRGFQVGTGSSKGRNWYVQVTKRF